MKIKRLFHPEIFQGDFSYKNYFEGWYFKHVSANSQNSFALIPGISISKNDSHSFIQYIDGISGDSQYFRYPLSSFKWNKKEFKIEIEDSIFTSTRCRIQLTKKQLSITGDLRYDHITPYPSRWYSPGIMGWYSFIPFMECYHGVVSVDHLISGSVSINKQVVNMTGGKGYIEKDWGKSFPESWIWMQCNNFKSDQTSLMFSIAKIPWRGNFFLGFICFTYIKGQFFLFNSYNKSKIDNLSRNENQLNVTFKNKKHRINISVTQNSSAELQAPKSGKMERIIKESIDSNIEFELVEHSTGNTFKHIGNRAGLEIIDSIFDYF